VFADDEGGGAGVDENFRAGGVELGDGVLMVETARDHLFVVPEVFADGEADDLIVDAGEIFVLAQGAGFEIAAFVENVVGRQEGFEMAAEDGAVAEKSDGIVEGAADGVLIRFGIADEGVEAVDLLGDGMDGGEIVGDELRLEEEVLGGIAGDGQFGKNAEGGAFGSGLRGKVEDATGVAGDVSDGGIDLGKGDAHGG